MYVHIMTLPIRGFPAVCCRKMRKLLKLKSKHRYSDGYYVFDFSKFMFVSENKKQKQVIFEKKDPDKILQAATEEMAFPF